jgi:hypothetical protein
VICARNDTLPRRSATFLSTLVHTPSVSSACFPYFPAGDGVWIGHRELVCTQRGREPKVGSDLERRLAAGGRDQHEAMGEKVVAAAWREKLAPVEIVHPLRVCGDEDIRRSAGLDLLRQGIAGTIRDDDGDAGLAFEFPGLPPNDSLRLAAANTLRPAEPTAEAPKTRLTPAIATATGFDPSEHAGPGTNEILKNGNIYSYITVARLRLRCTAGGTVVASDALGQTLAAGALADLRYDGAADSVRPPWNSHLSSIPSLRSRRTKTRAWR